MVITERYDLRCGIQHVRYRLRVAGLHVQNDVQLGILVVCDQFCRHRMFGKPLDERHL